VAALSKSRPSIFVGIFFFGSRLKNFGLPPAAVNPTISRARRLRQILKQQRWTKMDMQSVIQLKLKLSRLWIQSNVWTFTRSSNLNSLFLQTFLKSHQNLDYRVHMAGSQSVINKSVNKWREKKCAHLGESGTPSDKATACAVCKHRLINRPIYNARWSMININVRL
jgi:hypothetical protein